VDSLSRFAIARLGWRNDRRGLILHDGHLDVGGGALGDTCEGVLGLAEGDVFSDSEADDALIGGEFFIELFRDLGGEYLTVGVGQFFIADSAFDTVAGGGVHDRNGDDISLVLLRGFCRDAFVGHGDGELLNYGELAGEDKKDGQLEQDIYRRYHVRSTGRMLFEF
jgi:hypothetical protein